MQLFEFSFETEDELVKSVVDKYWAIDDKLKFQYNTRTLREEFKITYKNLQDIIKEVTVFCNAIRCLTCNLKRSVSSRNDFRINFKRSWICPSCLAKEAVENRIKYFNEAEIHKQIILNKFPYLELVDSVNEISLTDSIYLLSLIRLSVDDSLTYIRPLKHCSDKLSPTIEYDLFILQELLKKKVIAINSEAESKIFQNSNLDGNVLFDLEYIFPTEKNPQSSNFIKQIEIELSKDEFTGRESLELLALWKRLALNECLEYLNYNMNSYRLIFNPGEKTNLIFKSLLEKFSVSQVYNFIFRSVKDSAARYQKGDLSKRHAANIAIGSIQRYADKAISEKWNIKGYQRNFDCPQSFLSETLFNFVLRIGNIGFSEPPSLRFIPWKRSNHFCLLDIEPKYFD